MVDRISASIILQSWMSREKNMENKTKKQE